MIYMFYYFYSLSYCSIFNQTNGLLDLSAKFSELRHLNNYQDVSFKNQSEKQTIMPQKGFKIFNRQKRTVSDNNPHELDDDVPKLIKSLNFANYSEKIIKDAKELGDLNFSDINHMYTFFELIHTFFPNKTDLTFSQICNPDNHNLTEIMFLHRKVKLKGEILFLKDELQLMQMALDAEQKLITEPGQDVQTLWLSVNKYIAEINEIQEKLRKLAKEFIILNNTW